MAIDSFSKFFYGTTVTNENPYLNFSEGAGELSIQVPAKSYTPSELIQQIANSLNEVGGLTYSVGFNRFTRTVTISADGVFELLVNTGSQGGTSLFPLLGFEGADRTGLSSYEANKQYAKEYKVQLKFQSYVPPEHNQSLVQSVINKTATGAVEVVTFGTESFYEAELKFITNLPMDNYVIRNNRTGVEDATEFMREITKKRRFEIMPDEQSPDVFDKVILESTPEASDGTSFKLKELTSENIRDVYDIGILKLRVVT